MALALAFSRVDRRVVLVKVRKSSETSVFYLKKIYFAVVMFGMGKYMIKNRYYDQWNIKIE